MCPVAAPHSCLHMWRLPRARVAASAARGRGRGGKGEGSRRSGGSWRCLSAAAPSPLPFVTSARAPCPSARAVGRDGRHRLPLCVARAAVQKLRLCVMCLKYHTAIPRKSVVQTNDVQGGCATPDTGVRSALAHICNMARSFSGTANRNRKVHSRYAATERAEREFLLLR